MKFHSFHGCLPEERRDGADYLVDFICDYDIRKALQSDCLDDTLDYSRVYGIVAAQMAVPSKLLENVAGRIADAILSEFPSLEHFSVRVTKLHPPVEGECASSAVTLEL